MSVCVRVCSVWCMMSVLLLIGETKEDETKFYIGDGLLAHMSEDDQGGCRPSRDHPVCSNRGTCHFGVVCECPVMPDPQHAITGQYCECDNFSCVSVDGRICSGPERGECVCGKCFCQEPYTGHGCQIQLNTTTDGVTEQAEVQTTK